MNSSPDRYPFKDLLATTLPAAADSIRAARESGSRTSPSALRLHEIAWTLLHGPRDLDAALELLASPRAQQILTEQWSEECPSDNLLGKAVPPLYPSEAETFLADATRELLSLHTRSCSQCADILSDLDRAVAALDAPGEVLWTQHFASFTWRSVAIHRAAHTAGGPADSASAVFPLRKDRYEALTGDQIADYISLQANVTFSTEDEGILLVKVPLPRINDTRMIRVHVLLQDGNTWTAEAQWEPRFPPAGELVATYTGIGEQPAVEDIALEVIQR